MNGENIFPRWLLAILAAFLLIFAVSEITEITEPEERVIFSGEGEEIGIPDIAEINFSVVTDGETTGAVISENSKKMKEVVDFIKQSGIDEKDITTSGYFLNPRYDWKKGERISRGYELISTLSIKARDLDRIGEIIDGAVSRGANKVGDIRFVIDDIEAIRIKAREKAIIAAREKAQAVADAAGFKLGKIVSFSESGPIIDYARAEMSMMSMGGGEDAVPSIEKGSQEIKVVVSLTFELMK